MPSPYRAALEEAVGEYRELTVQRENVDKQIAGLRETILSLLRLLAKRGEYIDVAQIFDDQEMPDEEKKAGLSEAISDALKARDAFMTASEIKTALAGIGFNVSGYSDALPTITTTLTRLVGSDDVLVQEVRGTKVYKWNTSAFKHSPLKYLGQRHKGASAQPKSGKRSGPEPNWWRHMKEQANSTPEDATLLRLIDGLKKRN
jgi:hypothetical protein